MVLVESGTNESLIGYILSYPTIVTFLIFSFIIFCGFVATCIYRKISGKWIQSRYLVTGLFVVCFIAYFTGNLTLTKVNIFCFCVILLQIHLYIGLGYTLFEKKVSLEFLSLRVTCPSLFILTNSMRLLMGIEKQSMLDIIFIIIWIVLTSYDITLLLGKISANSEWEFFKTRYFLRAQALLNATQFFWPGEAILFVLPILRAIIMIIETVPYLSISNL